MTDASDCTRNNKGDGAVKGIPEALIATHLKAYETPQMHVCLAGAMDL